VFIQEAGGEEDRGMDFLSLRSLRLCGSIRFFNRQGAKDAKKKLKVLYPLLLYPLE
jgi:hypothetical protein